MVKLHSDPRSARGFNPEAIGLTDIDGIQIENPVQSGDVAPATPGPVKKIRFMLTRDLLQWIGDARTQEAGDIRMALWWFFSAADRDHFKGQLDRAESNIDAMKAELAEKDATLSGSNAIIEEENASKKAVIRSIHMPRLGNGREVFAVVFNPSIGHITSIRRTQMGFPPRVRELQKSGFTIIGTPARDVPNARYKWKAALVEMVKQSSVRRDWVRNEAKPNSDLNTYRILNGGDLDAVIAADCDEKEAKWLRGVLADIGITSANQMRMDKYL
ncbi:hypothetical protein CAPTEDRAFT_191455, partial [Capitella teleta]